MTSSRRRRGTSIRHSGRVPDRHSTSGAEADVCQLAGGAAIRGGARGKQACAPAGAQAFAAQHQAARFQPQRRPVQARRRPSRCAHRRMERQAASRDAIRLGSSPDDRGAASRNRSSRCRREVRVTARRARPPAPGGARGPKVHVVQHGGGAVQSVAVPTDVASGEANVVELADGQAADVEPGVELRDGQGDVASSSRTASRRPTTSRRSVMNSVR